MKRSSLALTIVYFTLVLNSGFSQTLKNKIIAHRGAWNTAIPENSIASLNRAIALQCGGTEFDVWMTADSILVINHDPVHKGLRIEASTYKELAAKKLSNGETIPTLEEYILAGKSQNFTRLILEIKTSGISKERTLKLAEKCVQTVKRLKAANLVDYISFDYDACLKVIELERKAAVSFLHWKGDIPPAKLKEDGFAGLDYTLDVYKQHPEYIHQARKLGLKTNVWTINDEKDMKWCLENNIDYITTDKPERLFKLLK